MDQDRPAAKVILFGKGEKEYEEDIINFNDVVTNH